MIKYHNEKFDNIHLFIWWVVMMMMCFATSLYLYLHVGLAEDPTNLKFLNLRTNKSSRSSQATN